MESIKPTTEELKHYMGKPEFIRNVSILAHVDHGKTTLCDALLATNRLVSKRLAGTVRYLDDRPDEQERGITMKSSAVSLLNVVRGDNEKPTPILLNLIDTPGHIDFSTEVGAALRVCDGAFILVDLAEGVCVQTRECIKKAMQEKCRMILILNKFDRLVVEMKLDVFEIFNYIIRAIESCNVVVAETYQVEYPDTQVDVEDSGFLFSPDTGNVIFASAIHGWGFTLRQLAQLCLPLVVDETVESLTVKLWDFDCYVDQKKVVKTGAILKGRDNLFKQFCVRTIMAIYEIIVVRMDRSKVPNVLQKLGITTASKDMTHNDPKIQIKAIMQAWRPIAETILLQSLKIFPNPCELSEEKVDYLLGNAPDTIKKQLSEGCNTIAYVSKMFCVEQGVKSKVVMPTPRGEILEKRMAEVSLDPQPQIEVIALARVFTGSLEIGQAMFVLHQKGHEKVQIKNLYMLFGKDLMSVEKVPPGNFCGISGLEHTVIRTATLSSTLEMTPFYESPALEPVIRNSIEPANPKDLPVLRQGLKLLMQSDSCVQVIMQENGEIVLLTAGDVHLAKCIEDLTKKFAKIEVHVSSPMVALRETILKLENEEDYISNTNNHLNIENEYFKLSTIATQIPEDILNSITKKQEITHQIWSQILTNKSTNVLVNLAQKPQYIDKCIVNAFNTVTKSGPICEEPLMNVAFIITQFTPLQELKPEHITPQLSSNIENLVKQTLRKAFEKREQRLMEPLFTTDIQVNTNILGKVYSVVSKRYGKVLDAVGMDEEEKVYLVKAQIPVIESTGFANEIRTATSGQANPNLKFSHYEIIDGDPFYVPVEEEDEEDLNIESAIRASKIRRELRLRKGLYVEDQVVVHAEKQRTLNKKK